MSNTIELLETIGSDASLRHASGPELTQALADMHASESLRQAAVSGDSAPLTRELGHRDMKATKSPTQTGFEDEEDAAEGDMPGSPDRNRSQ